jgi:hypothetical protein
VHDNHDELYTNLLPSREGAACISDHIRLYYILMIRPYHKIKKNAQLTHTLWLFIHVTYHIYIYINIYIYIFIYIYIYLYICIRRPGKN